MWLSENSSVSRDRDDALTFWARPQSTVESELTVDEQEDPRDGRRQYEDVLSWKPGTELHGREQVQTQAADEIETADHVPEQIREDWMKTGELAPVPTDDGRIYLLLGDDDSVISLRALDASTPSRSDRFAFGLSPLAVIKPLFKGHHSPHKSWRGVTFCPRIMPRDRAMCQNHRIQGPS